MCLCVCRGHAQHFPSLVTIPQRRVQRRRVQEQVETCRSIRLWKGRLRPRLCPAGRVSIGWTTPVNTTETVFRFSFDLSCCRRLSDFQLFFVHNLPPKGTFGNPSICSVLVSGASSVLQSPDGNWIALQSSQLSRPSLLTKRKSLVFSVLEKESGVVSAYDEMGSDSEEDDQGGWGTALRQFRRKLSDETYYTDSQHDPEWTYTQHLPITSPSSGQYTNTETLNSDSEASSVPPTYPRKPPHNVFRKKGLSDTHLHPHHQPLYHQHLHQNFSPSPLHSETLDVNFNPKVI